MRQSALEKMTNHEANTKTEANRQHSRDGYQEADIHKYRVQFHMNYLADSTGK